MGWGDRQKKTAIIGPNGLAAAAVPRPERGTFHVVGFMAQIAGVCLCKAPLMIPVIPGAPLQQQCEACGLTWHVEQIQYEEIRATAEGQQLPPAKLNIGIKCRQPLIANPHLQG